ncbi:putative phage abortive infection protein [Salinivibrio sp. KP-1]|uniref:putative phage abortive infection protein n=1 Tax=Salinivibrio sp. KP-1 TaxID=1406902 RepID=UPI0006964DE0|nr:putative phage abortive infection protein [Salinivibrio sp. KP-1]
MGKSETDAEIEKLQKKIKWSWWAAGITASLVLVTYFGWFSNSGSTLSLDTTVWGGFGSYFGGILGPIVALFALYWLTQSVLIQKKELSDTQKTLEETQKTQEKKRFEDTFFSLLEQFNSVSREVYDVNKKLYDAINTSSNECAGTSNNLDIIKIIISRVHWKQRRYFYFTSSQSDNSNLNDLSHYFRVLYHILKYVDYADSFSSNERVIDNGKFYTNIVRSFLSHRETMLLAFNCAEENKNDQFYNYKRLIEKYEMLEHMRVDDDFVGLVSFYNRNAFGKNEKAQEYYNLMDELGFFDPPRSFSLRDNDISSTRVWRMIPFK